MIKLLTRVQQPGMVEKLWQKQETMDVSLLELARLLQNLVASAVSLIDLNRNIKKAYYSNTEFGKEYQGEINKRFARDPIAGFVKDLRNYVLHYKFLSPEINLIVKVDPDTQKRAIIHPPVTINKAHLLEWAKLSERGKTYLDAVEGNKIELQVVIEEYARAVEAFQQWMMTRLLEIHNDELRWFVEKGWIVKEAWDKFRGET
jgi:hypothetical protein